MTHTLRNPLVIVWALLTIVTILSWWISRDSSQPLQLDSAITLSVLGIAALKVRLVMRYFMEIRFAPTWLKLTTDGWLLVLLVLLWLLY